MRDNEMKVYTGAGEGRRPAITACLEEDRGGFNFLRVKLESQDDEKNKPRYAGLPGSFQYQVLAYQGDVSFSTDRTRKRKNKKRSK